MTLLSRRSFVIGQRSLPAVALLEYPRLKPGRPVYARGCRKERVVQPMPR